MNNMVRYAVIPLAGLGTRMTPVSKAIPKELLPIPVYAHGKIVLYPMIQVIYKKLFEVDIRKFCFVISPDKTSIKNYFEPDYEYVDTLRSLGKDNEAEILEEFYRLLEKSHVEFIIQEKPLGVGDAVLRCKDYVNDNKFLLNMGDDIILNHTSSYYRKLLDLFHKEEADACVFIMNVDNPKHYGVVKGNIIKSDIIEIEEIIEKPVHVVSNLAIISTYVFNPYIFNKLEELKEGNRNWELTDAVQNLIKEGKKVLGYIINENVKRIDIGRPESYIDIFIDFMKERNQDC